MTKSKKWTIEDLDFCTCREDTATACGGRDALDHSMLRAAIEFNRRDLAEGLLGLGAPIDAGLDQNYESVLTLAARHADGDMVRLLCKSGANVRQTFEYDWTGLYMRDEIGRGLTALHLAAGAGNVSAVQALVELGADVNATTDDDLEWTPLFKAVDFLEQEPAVVSRRGDIVDYLLDHGAIPQDRSMREHTWMRMSELARRHGYTRLVQALDGTKK